MKPMDPKVVLSLITLLGVVVTAFVTWLIAQRRLMGEHVTAERRKWRDRIRQKALEAHVAIVTGKTDDASKLQDEFRALLNPFDRNDLEILRCIDAEGCNDCRKDRARKFGRSISLLLKHDWERAKLEAGFFPSSWFVEARRFSLDCADGKDGDRCPETARSCEKFEIKWNRIFVCLVLLLPAIVWLVVLWFRALQIVLFYVLETALKIWECVLTWGGSS